MAGQLRVDEITDEAGTGSPSFPVGNVGIGTSSPSGTLDVVGGTVNFRNPTAFTGGENFTRPDVIISGANDTSGNVTRLCIQSQSGALVFLDNTCVASGNASDLAIRLRTSSLGAVVMPKVKEYLHTGQQRSVIPGGSTIYQETPCRAWVNFDGTTTTPTIRASVNVSSVTRNGTGDYTVSFATAMPDANYCAAGNTGDDNSTNTSSNFGSLTTTNFRCFTRSQFTNAARNQLQNTVAVFR